MAFKHDPQIFFLQLHDKSPKQNLMGLSACFLRPLTVLVPQKLHLFFQRKNGNTISALGTSLKIADKLTWKVQLLTLVVPETKALETDSEENVAKPPYHTMKR